MSDESETDETIVDATVIEEPASVETPIVGASSEKVVDAEVVDDPEPPTVGDDIEKSEEAEAAARFLARANADVESTPAARAHARTPREGEPARVHSRQDDVRRVPLRSRRGAYGRDAHLQAPG
ncbi:hypothetical protein [Microbacterium sp. Se63.02b]|uniref:hypothetical protein n=1 Tax=Microbacterium sp. Se63.02b TaxID=2709304 RepID=UPI00160548AB|nr:hypothetical protein [Microbacterium sp. Se63.02b]QNA92930.1 hypothetical protein G4G29_12235 [Microbacterium sp. Se63.02b]